MRPTGWKFPGPLYRTSEVGKYCPRAKLARRALGIVLARNTQHKVGPKFLTLLKVVTCGHFLNSFLVLKSIRSRNLSLYSLHLLSVVCWCILLVLRLYLPYKLSLQMLSWQNKVNLQIRKNPTEHF